jgi:hypothetical protein
VTDKRRARGGSKGEKIILYTLSTFHPVLYLSGPPRTHINGVKIL